MDPNQNPQPIQPQPGVPVDPSMPQQPTSASQFDPSTQPPQPQPMLQPTLQPAMPVVEQSMQPPVNPMMQQPAQPMPAASAFPQPAAPMQQSVPNSAFQGPAAAVPIKKPFPLGLVLKLTGGLLTLVVLAVGGWFAYTTFFGGIPVKEYQGDDFSMLVPKDYDKEDKTFGDGIRFEKPGVDDDEKSVVSVSSLEFDDKYLTRDKMIEAVDEGLNEDKIKEQYDDTGSLSDLKINKSAKLSGVEARRVTATANKKGKKVGSLDVAYIFGDKKIYVVAVIAHVSEPGLAQSSGKIINSFKIK